LAYIKRIWKLKARSFFAPLYYAADKRQAHKAGDADAQVKIIMYPAMVFQFGFIGSPCRSLSASHSCTLNHWAAMRNIDAATFTN